jgi:hypothetical protein
VQEVVASVSSCRVCFHGARSAAFVHSVPSNWGVREIALLGDTSGIETETSFFYSRDLSSIICRLVFFIEKID